MKIFIKILPVFLLTFGFFFQDTKPKLNIDSIEKDSLEDFRTIFGIDYFNAVCTLKDQLPVISKCCNKYKADTSIVACMIFPELIRYSGYKDFLETSVLEILYKKFGTEKADFSIGYFQMKPSFLEKIENYLKHSELGNLFPEIVNYAYTDIYWSRNERLQRLKNTNFQILYAVCLYKILEEKFSFHFNRKEEKLRFYSACYNSDFSLNYSEICKKINKRFFPYGSNYKGKQYCYADVALHFYIKYY